MTGWADKINLTWLKCLFFIACSYAVTIIVITGGLFLGVERPARFLHENAQLLQNFVFAFLFAMLFVEKPPLLSSTRRSVAALAGSQQTPTGRRAVTTLLEVITTVSLIPSVLGIALFTNFGVSRHTPEPLMDPAGGYDGIAGYFGVDSIYGLDGSVALLLLPVALTCWFLAYAAR